MATTDIKDFISENFVKVLWGIIVYFLMQLSNDFKDVKTTLQQMLINQATMEQRMSNIESQVKQNTVDINTQRDKGNK